MKRTEPTKHRPLRRALTLLLALMLAALALSGCKKNAAVGAQTNPTDEPSAEHTDEPTALPEFIKQISTADDNNEASGKPLSTQHIQLSCLSFYARGSKIIVDAAMGDMYSSAQESGHYPSFDSFGENGYPLFYVLDDDIEESLDFNRPKDYKQDSKLIINGERGGYAKRFGREDMEELDIPLLDKGTERARIPDPSEWHHETVEIDFSALECGDYGDIRFTFVWNGKEEKFPETSGQCVTLGYYVGEEGIALSNRGWITAMEEYGELENIEFYDPNFPYC